MQLVSLNDNHFSFISVYFTAAALTNRFGRLTGWGGNKLVSLVSIVISLCYVLALITLIYLSNVESDTKDEFNYLYKRVNKVLSRNLPDACMCIWQASSVGVNHFTST